MKAKKTNKTLKGKKKFSVIGIVAFAVVFVGIGIYVVFTTFATTNYPNCYLGENYPGCSTIASGTTRHGVVTVAQKELRALCYTPIAVDGDFGPQTKQRVMQFQLNKGLPQTGIINYNDTASKSTWYKLERDYKERKANGTLNICD